MKYEVTKSKRNRERRILTVRSIYLEDDINYIIDNNIEGIHITSWRYKEENLDFLKECKCVKELYLDSVRLIDYSAIEYLTLLDTIVIENLKKPIDLSLVKQIKCLETEYKYVRNINTAKGLEELSLYRFNPRSKNFKELEGLSNLKKLWILFSNIDSLNGIDSLKSLNQLEMVEMTRLNDITHIEGLSECLTSLRIDNAYKLSDFAAIGKLVNLKDLFLCNNKEIESLHFLSKLNYLNSCILEGTTVLDESIPIHKSDFEKSGQFNNEEHKTHIYHKNFYINQLLLSMHDFLKTNHETCQYTLSEINECARILEKFLNSINDNKDSKIKDIIEETVEELNALNASTTYSLIETEQRELICSLMVNAVGIEAIDFIDMFREW